MLDENPIRSLTSSIESSGSSISRRSAFDIISRFLYSIGVTPIARLKRTKKCESDRLLSLACSVTAQGFE